MLPELSQTMIDRWDRYFPGEKRPRRMSYLGIPGSVQGGTTTFMGFADGNERPSFLVKIHRASDDMEGVANEKRILETVNASGWFDRSVPRLFLCEEIGGLWVLVQSILDGRPMRAAMTPTGLPDTRIAGENIGLASEWLAGFNDVAKETDPARHDRFRTFWNRQIEEFRRIFTPRGAEDDFLDEIEAAVDSICAGKCGLVTRHGDFCRQNILVSKKEGGIGVVDWSFSQKGSLPLHDLFFFLTTYFLQSRRDHGTVGFTRAFEQTWFDTNDYSRLVRASVDRFCRRTGADRQAAPLQFGMFLAEQAVFEYHQSVRSSASGGLPRFNIYLASLGNKDHQEALKEHLYIYFFRTFIAKREKFILS